MGEPVGNGPRSDIPGNSYREQAAKRVEKVETPREKVEKVVTGKVVQRKQPWYKKLARNMIADDAQTIGDFLIHDVLIPSVKNVIFDAVSQGSSRALFGTSGRGQSRSGRSGQSRGGAHFKTRYDQMAEEPRRGMSREARARHEFDEIILDSREDANSVIDDLIELVTKYGSATIADLYDLVGISGTFVDRHWGWSDLRTADVRQVRGGWILDLPRTIELR